MASGQHWVIEMLEEDMEGAAPHDGHWEIVGSVRGPHDEAAAVEQAARDILGLPAGATLRATLWADVSAADKDAAFMEMVMRQYAQDEKKRSQGKAKQKRHDRIIRILIFLIIVSAVVVIGSLILLWMT